MSFQKIVGVIQIIFSFILISIPLIGINLYKKAYPPIIALIPADTNKAAEIILIKSFSVIYYFFIILIAINVAIGLVLILQGILNLKEE